MICKICNRKEAHPKYYGMCSPCRTKKYAYSRGKKCVDCGKLVSNQNERCKTCYPKTRRNRVKRTCQECGKSYITKASVRRFFCGQICANIYRARNLRENKIAFKKSDTLEKTGYVTGHSAYRKRRVRVHVRIAEHILGRKLKSGEVVHHINLDKSDNRHCNLLICNQSYNMWLHHQMAAAWVKEHITTKEAH